MSDITVTIVKEAAKALGKLFESAVVEGIVSDENGKPVPNAIVSLGGKEDTTAVNGKFIIENPKSGIHLISLTYDGVVIPNIDKVHIGKGDKLSLEIKIPSSQTPDVKTIKLQAQQFVQITALYDKNENEDLILHVRLDKELKVDKTLQTYGSLTDFEKDKFKTYPFILRFDGEKGVMDYANWQSSNEFLNIYDKEVLEGETLIRTNEAKDGEVGTWNYKITNIKILSI